MPRTNLVEARIEDGQIIVARHQQVVNSAAIELFEIPIELFGNELPLLIPGSPIRQQVTPIDHDIRAVFFGKLEECFVLPPDAMQICRVKEAHELAFNGVSDSPNFSIFP